MDDQFNKFEKQSAKLSSLIIVYMRDKWVVRCAHRSRDVERHIGNLFPQFYVRNILFVSVEIFNERWNDYDIIGTELEVELIDFKVSF